MSAKNTRSTPRTSVANESQSPAGLFAQAWRQQLALISDTTNTLLHSAEAMQSIQQQVARQSSRRLETATQKLDGNSSPSELLAIQSEIWSIDPQAASAYWRDMASTMLQAQNDLMTCVGSAFKSQDGGALKPAFDAWQTMLSNLGTASQTQA